MDSPGVFEVGILISMIGRIRLCAKIGNEIQGSEEGRG